MKVILRLVARICSWKTKFPGKHHVKVKVACCICSHSTRYRMTILKRTFYSIQVDFLTCRGGCGSGGRRSGVHRGGDHCGGVHRGGVHCGGVHHGDVHHGDVHRGVVRERNNRLKGLNVC